MTPREGQSIYAKPGFRHARRAPRQKRSQLLVERILASAKALFEHQGYAYVSTNHIAAEAGISIGSLYQYFPNREAIAVALYERSCADAALIMKRTALEIMGWPISESLPRHIEALFGVFEKDRYVLLQLAREYPELARAAQPVSFENLIHHTAQIYLEQHFTEADPVAIARKCYVMEKAVLGVITGYLDERPDFIDKAAAIAETTQLLSRFVATLSNDANSAAHKS